MNDKVFNPSVILPMDLVITPAGTHLYLMGLSLYPKCSELSPKLHNPLLIFKVNSIVALRSCVSLLLSEDNKNAFEMLFRFDLLYKYKTYIQLYYNMMRFTFKYDKNILINNKRVKLNVDKACFSKTKLNLYHLLKQLNL